MLGVRHRDNAVAEAEPAVQIFLGGIVRNAEELAEVEAGLVDIQTS